MKFLIVLLFVASAHASEGAPQLSEERAIFHTTAGDIVVGFFPKVAPKHVAQMLNLIRAHVYDGTPIGRIERGFVAQVFNKEWRQPPLDSEQLKIVHHLPAEFSDLKHNRGTLSMARYDDPNSAETSFSFLLGPAPHLDGKYTIFGMVIAGWDVLSAIENLPVNRKSEPQTPVSITGAEVVDASVLNTMTLQPAVAGGAPNPGVNKLFEVFAAVMFFFTVATPIVKSVMSRRG